MGVSKEDLAVAEEFHDDTEFDIVETCDYDVEEIKSSRTHFHNVLRFYQSLGRGVRSWEKPSVEEVRMSIILSTHSTTELASLGVFREKAEDKETPPDYPRSIKVRIIRLLKEFGPLTPQKLCKLLHLKHKFQLPYVLERMLLQGCIRGTAGCVELTGVIG